MSLLIAGEVLGYPRLVVSDIGKVKLFDPASSPQGNVIGFTAHSAALDAPVSVLIAGIVKYTGWGLTPDVPYFGIASGLISTSAPASGIIQPVGIAIDADSLLINFTAAIEQL